MKIAKYISIILISVMFVSLMPFYVFASEKTEFAVTDVKVRNGADGTFSDNYLYKSNGLDTGVGIFSDRDYRFSNIPNEFVGCGYIRTGKNDVSNTYFTDKSVTDWLTFKINQSATIYIVDYFRTNVAPASWLAAQEWNFYETNEIIWNTSAGYSTSKRVFYKHFDVSEGETYTVSLGGYDVVPYDNYSVFIKPDSLVGNSNYRFNKTELDSPEWEAGILNNLGNAFVMACGAKKSYLNTIRYDIDETGKKAPFKSESVVYIPVDFTVEMLGAGVSVNENSVTVSNSGKTYILSAGSNVIKANGNTVSISAPVLLKDGVFFAPADIVEKIFSYHITLSDDGAIIIKTDDNEIETTLLEKTEALFMMSPSEVTLRAEYLNSNDEIVIRDGIYYDIGFCINFNTGGALTVKPQTPGKVKFKGDCRFEFTGNNILIKDFYFEEARTVGETLIDMNGFSNGRLTGCYFYKCGSKVNSGNPMIHVHNKSQYNRFDHNTFERNQSMGIAITQQDDSFENLNNTYNTIDHNYVVDIRSDIEEWGISGSMEAFQVGIGDRFQPLYTTVEYNLIESCIGDGNEIIGNKSSYNTYRNNTFLNNRNGYWQIRTGDNITIDGNYFINNLSGISVYGSGHKITNNYFYNSIEDSIRIPTGNYKEKTYYYKEASDNLIANNTFLGFNLHGIVLGSGFNGLSEKYTYSPKNNEFINNLFIMERGKGIADYGSINTLYKNNLAVINGASDLGVNNYNGFRTVYPDRSFDFKLGFGNINFKTKNPKIELDYINGVYVPKESDYINGAGIPDERILEDNESIADIGINNARERAEAEGPLNADMVGPENRWWINELRFTPCKDFDSKAQGVVVGYEPSVNSVVIAKEESFDLHALSGKATYSNKESYYAPLSEVKYEITGGKDILRCDGRYLFAVSSGTGTVKATYKGYSSYITVKVIETTDNYSMNFDSSSESLIYLSGSYEIKNGKLVFASPGSFVSDKSYLKGNYSVSFDVTLKDIGKEGVYKTDARLIFGYKMNPSKEYYSVNFGAKDFYRNGIYKQDGYYLPNRIADLTKFVDTDNTYHMELCVYGKNVVFLINGELACVYEAKEEIEGMIGFGSLMNGAEFDNVSVKKLSEVEAIEKKPLNISSTQTDVYEATLSFNKIDGVIYRVFRNGIWLSDTTETIFTDTTLESGNVFNYKIRAIDKNSKIVAEESHTVTLPEEVPDNIFYISDVAYRTGENGAFEPDIYHGFNKGLNMKTWVFHNYNYTYTDLPAEFLNAAYIQVSNSFRTHKVATDSATKDWLTFNLNNDSADVYLAFYMNDGVEYPAWLTDEGWELTDYEISHQNGSMKSSAVYKKSFELSEGEIKKVTVGGFGCIPKRVYSIIIKRR